MRNNMQFSFMIAKPVKHQEDIVLDLWGTGVAVAKHSELTVFWRP